MSAIQGQYQRRAPASNPDVSSPDGRPIGVSGWRTQRSGTRAVSRRRFLRAMAHVAAAAGPAVMLTRGAAAGPASAGTPDASGSAHAVVLLYHRFGGASHPETNVTVAQLDAQITALRSGGHSVLPVPEILGALHEGLALPPKTVGITVDDGDRSFAETAWPRFRAAGLPVTLFVSPDAADRPGSAYLGWGALRQLAEEGVTIGNHSMSHPHLPGLPVQEIRRQIVGAQEALARNLGIRPRLFAYPFGEWDPTVREIAAEAGFVAAFGQQSGAIWSGSDRLALPRFPINERYGTPDRFRMVAETLPLPLTGIRPANPVLGGNMPPQLRFAVAPGVGNLDRLACYVSYRSAPVPVRRIGDRRFAVDLPGPMPAGRSRVNCTVPVTGDDGRLRWRWFGLQFQVPEGGAAAAE